MKSFAKAVTDIDRALVRAFEDACKVATKQDPTQFDAEKVWHTLDQAARHAGHDSLDGAQGEIREHLTQQYQQSPHNMSREEAEKLVEQQWNEVKHLSDRILKAAPKVEAAAKWGWLKFVGATTAIFAATLGLLSLHDWVSPETRAALGTLRREEVRQHQVEELTRIVLQQDEFNMFIGGVAPAPAVAPPTPAVAAMAAPLPPPIAAVAAAPAQVEVTSSSGTRQTINTTVERVYREAPEPVQRYMQENPPQPFHIEHDYDKPTDYRVNLDDYRTPARHKTFTVSTDFASATISY